MVYRFCYFELLWPSYGLSKFTFSILWNVFVYTEDLICTIMSCIHISGHMYHTVGKLDKYTVDDACVKLTCKLQTCFHYQYSIMICSFASIIWCYSFLLWKESVVVQQGYYIPYWSHGYSSYSYPMYAGPRGYTPTWSSNDYPHHILWYHVLVHEYLWIIIEAMWYTLSWLCPCVAVSDNIPVGFRNIKLHYQLWCLDIGSVQISVGHSPLAIVDNTSSLYYQCCFVIIISTNSH